MDLDHYGLFVGCMLGLDLKVYYFPSPLVWSRSKKCGRCARQLFYTNCQADVADQLFNRCRN